MLKQFDVVVIGGGPCGLTAALYAAREGVDTLVIERSGLGGQAGTTAEIANFPGFPDGVAAPAVTPSGIFPVRAELLQQANDCGKIPALRIGPDGPMLGRETDLL